MNEITNLKAELHRLNCHSEAERNEEVRHALARLRLEAERTQVLVKLMEAYAGVSEQPKPVVASGYKVSIQAVPQGSEPNGVSKLAPGSFAEHRAASANGALSNGSTSPHKYGKPPGLPSVASMIVAALDDAAKRGQVGLRSKELTGFVRKTWWPEARGVLISSAAWHMAKVGKLEKDGAVYKLNGHG